MLKNCVPHELLTLPNKCKLIVFFDENGSTSALSRINKDIECGKNIDENIRYFTLTSCVYRRRDYLQNKYFFKKIKKTYFENDMSIVFHTRDIKKENGPFKFYDDDTRKRFITDLSDSIGKVKFNVISITFDLLYFVANGNDIDPYKIAIDEILKILFQHLNRKDKCVLVFESRGKHEDKIINTYLNEKMGILCDTKIDANFKNHIIDICFNKKINEKTKEAVVGLEMADLCSYPIYRYLRFCHEGSDFTIVKNKILGYTGDLKKCEGIKVFPDHLIK